MNVLGQFDAAAAVRGTATGGTTVASAVPLIASPRIPNGLYTVTFPDGSHRTLKIRRQADDAKFAPGKRIISLLIGPDNTEDYEEWGWVTEEGITPWHKYRGKGGQVSQYERFGEILWALAAMGEIRDGYELAVSRRCGRCNRTLTTPESIALGYGPECWGFVREDRS